jgi:hypothetical protein
MNNQMIFRFIVLGLLAAILIAPSYGKAGSNSTSTDSPLADNSSASIIAAKTSTPGDASPGVSPSVAITGASFKEPAPVREHLNEEWVEISNKGTGAQDMKGWTLSDAGNHTYKFQDFTLQPKASVKVHTGKGDNSVTDIYWGRTSSVWNNDGDTATLKDGSGKEIARHQEGKPKARSSRSRKASKE